MAQHGLLHERVAGTHRDAVAARHAARLLNRRPAVPEHARVRVLPVDGQGLVDLDVLARFDAAPAEDALVGIVAVERVGLVDLVRLGLERNPLVLDREQLGRVVNGAVAVVVVAHRAVEDVIAEDAVERLDLRAVRGGRDGAHDHAVGDGRRARPDEPAVDLDHAGVAGLDRAELRVVTDVRKLGPDADNGVDETLIRPRLADDSIDCQSHHEQYSGRRPSDGSDKCPAIRAPRTHPRHRHESTDGSDGVRNRTQLCSHACNQDRAAQKRQRSEGMVARAAAGASSSLIWKRVEGTRKRTRGRTPLAQADFSAVSIAFSTSSSLSGLSR